jgi:hypothetical protein
VAESAWEQKAALVAEALNLLAVLAAPRLYSRWCTRAAPAELRTALETRMAALAAFCTSAEGSPDAERFRKAAPQVQALAEAIASAPRERFSDQDWEPLARECLDVLGFEAPPGGWETFEGWPDSSG